jgi:hypothetical protein
MIEHTFKTTPSGDIQLDVMGLKVEVKPTWLIQNMMSTGASKILDGLIESSLKEAIYKFDQWYLNNIENNHGAEGAANSFSADIVRYLLPIHSDSEMIELSDREKNVLDGAKEFWRYNKFYGFKY